MARKFQPEQLAEISEFGSKRQLQLTDLESSTPAELRKKFIAASIINDDNAVEFALDNEFYEDFKI